MATFTNPSFNPLNPVGSTLPYLKEGQVVSFSDITGLEGAQNKFVLQGKQFVPILGDGAQFGEPTQLPFSAQSILPFGFGVRPLSTQIQPGVAPVSTAIQPGTTLEQSQQRIQAALGETTPKPQQTNTTPALQQNIVPHPDAPQGWGIDITTGRFAKLTTAQPTAAPTPTQQGTPDRLLGPNEFAGLVKQLQVGPANFDQYFRRTPEGDIYLKGTQAPTPTAPTTGITPVSRPIESLKIGGIDIGQFRELTGIPGLIEQENQIRKQLLEAHNALPSRLSLLEQETRKQGLGTIADSIAEIQKTVQSQQNALRDLPEAVKERAVPFKVTASQLQRLTAKEREPMARALADLLTSQNILQQQWDRKHELAKEAAAAGEVDAQRALKGIELQLGFIQSDRKKAENLFEMLIDIARKEKQDLISSLRGEGYVFNEQGELVPTLARQREERIAGGVTPTGTPTPTAPKPSPTPTSKPAVDQAAISAYVDSINAGQLKLAQVPAKLRTEVTKQLQAGPQPKTVSETEARTVINTLKTQGKSLDEVIQIIQREESIQNKDELINIARTLYQPGLLHQPGLLQRIGGALRGIFSQPALQRSPLDVLKGLRR